MSVFILRTRLRCIESWSLITEDRNWLITDVFHPVISAVRTYYEVHDVMRAIDC